MDGTQFLVRPLPGFLSLCMKLKTRLAACTKQDLTPSWLYVNKAMANSLRF